MKLIFIALLISASLQAQEGAYFGKCYNNYHKYSSQVVMTLKLTGGNQYQINAVESSEFGVTAWSVEFFTNGINAFVFRKKVQTHYPRNFKEYKTSACLCEDNLSLTLGRNTAFQFLEAICTVNAITWSLKGFQKLTPLPVLKQTSVNRKRVVP